MIVPKFFEYVAQDNTYRNTIKFNTPMDYLEEILDECRVRNPRGNKSIADIMVKAKSLDGGFNNTKQQEDIFNIISKCSKKINSLLMPNCKLNSKSKIIIIRNAKNETKELLKNMSINPKTIYSILHKCFGENKKNHFSKIGMITLSLLYSTHTIKVLAQFKNTNNKNEEILIKDENGKIDIFGVKYSFIKRCKIT